MAFTGRTTVYNKLTSPELIKKINPNNKALIDDYLSHISGLRSPGTIKEYRSDLRIFACYILQYLDNKDFTAISKREFSRFQSYGMNDLGWSSDRLRRVKSVISSLSNFIENVLDDEYPEYRASIRKIENPAKQPVREKSIFTLPEIVDVAEQLIADGKIQIACCLMLCAASGKRKQELSRFKVSYFDAENIIYGSLYKTPEKIKSKGRGPGGKMLPAYVIVKTFKKYLDLWMQEREKLGIKSEWLFVVKNQDGTYDQAKGANLDHWKEVINKYTKQYFYWHALRHMFVTQLKRCKIPDSVIQEIIGWETPDMVGIYNDLDADEEIGNYFNEDGIVENTGNIKDL